MVGRRGLMKSLLGMGLAMTVLQAAAACGDYGVKMNLGCYPNSCGDFNVTASDNGRTIRLAVGQWIFLELPVALNSAMASSSDPNVIAQQGGAGYQNESLFGFHALKPGSARLTSAIMSSDRSAVVASPVTCLAGSTEPCSYEVDVEVVQFPKAKITIDNVSESPAVHLRVGEVARFQAPYSSSPLWTVSIDSPSIVNWIVEPIYPDSLMEAAVVAKSPGTAHIQSTPCASSEPVCSNPWHLTFVVA